MHKERNTPQELILSIFLTREYEFCVEHIGSFRSEWFDIALHRKVFESISDQLRKGKDPNILTVSIDLKTKGELSNGDPARISAMTLANHEWKVSIAGLVDAIKEDFHRKAVQKMYNSIGQNLAEHSFNIDKVMEEAEKLRAIITEQGASEKSNAEVVNDILIQHDKAKSGKKTGIKLGFSNTDQYIELESVDMMVIGGRPAMGKTANAISVAINLAFDQGLKVPFFALEMSKEQVVRRLIGALTGIDTRKIRKGQCNEEELRLIQSLMTRKEWDNLYIYEGSRTSRSISDILLKHKHSDGCDVFILDYLQKVTNNKGKDIFEKATYNSNEIKEIIQDLNIAGICYAQLKRGNKDQPKLSDIRNTGDIEQDASIVAFLHRPEYYGIMKDEEGNDTTGIAEFIIAKNREDGLTTLKFNLDLTTSKWTPYEKKEGYNPIKEPNDVPF